MVVGIEGGEEFVVGGGEGEIGHWYVLMLR